MNDHLDTVQTRIRTPPPHARTTRCERARTTARPGFRCGRIRRPFSGRRVRRAHAHRATPSMDGPAMRSCRVPRATRIVQDGRKTYGWASCEWEAITGPGTHLRLINAPRIVRVKFLWERSSLLSMLSKEVTCSYGNDATCLFIGTW